MPAKSTTIDFSRYGTEVLDAFNESKDTPANQGVVRLPGGISNGIAKLRECYFKTGEKGDYWRAAGEVVAPEHAGTNGSMVPLRGLTTSVVVMIKPDDVKKAFAEILNHLKLLAGGTVLLAAPRDVATSVVKLGAYLTALSEKVAAKGPYFRFSTELGRPTPAYPEPKVWERWHGSAGLEGYTPTGTTTPTQVAMATSVPGFDTPNPTVAATVKAPVRTAKAPLPVQPEPVTVTADDEDVLSLLDRAKNNDKGADARLRELAAEKGHDDDEFDKAGWEEIEGWFTTGVPDGGAGDDPFGPVRTPEIGEVLVFAPADPKDRSGVKRLKGEQFEVVELHTNTETMTLRSIKGVKGKKLTVNDVAWSDPNVTWDS